MARRRAPKIVQADPLLFGGEAFEPIDSVRWAAAREAGRKRYYARLGAELAREHDAQLADGRDRFNRKMRRRLRPRRGVYRGAGGPVLTPFEAESKARKNRRMLVSRKGVRMTWVGKARKTYARQRVRPSVKQLLTYHAQGIRSRAGRIKRDVMGVAPSRVQRAVERTRKWWAKYRPEPTPTPTPGAGPKRRDPADDPGPGLVGLPPRVHRQVRKYPWLAPWLRPDEDDEPRPKPKPKPKPKPQPAVIPPGPIRDRIAVYRQAEGDRLREAFLADARPIRDRLEAIGDERRALLRTIDERDQQYQSELNRLARRMSLAKAREQLRPTLEETDRLRRKLPELSAEASGLRTRIREALVARLEVPASERAEIRVEAPTGTISTYGGELLDPADRQTLATAREAAAWLQRMTRRGDASGPGVAVRVAQPRPGGIDRAHYNRDARGGYIKLRVGGGVETAVHELGHALDDQIRQGGEPVGRKSVEYRDARTAGGRKGDMRTDFDPGYSADEWYREGFDPAAFGGERRAAAYAGRIYRGEADSEVLALGVGQLYTDPLPLAENDPEYFALVVGLLRGDLR